jgi:hypothetical protein
MPSSSARRRSDITAEQNPVRVHDGLGYPPLMHSDSSTVDCNRHEHSSPSCREEVNTVVLCFRGIGDNPL